ncbi:DUF421 domain-containing protein [Mucilaginibacter pallidiroseus]|uniref:DUF421 domain-containing protein n=1 Tax=Mucilaginibacter pallidiroseus TaxID=2599295 RepID=A0A563UJS2_9SPHI|nr:YetF domain-containing protein [Mucilaginibacter pallidiroseus]TWR31549.1 DUF421 domain-containing protein [Mucilaginibacter pallidiroseus]
MKPEDIKFGDLQRMFIGEVPGAFFIELIIRALIIYLILMVAMRSMGKRMSSQLSRNELAAMVSLAAAIGVPMMAPDRGILPAIVIAFVLVAIQRTIAKAASKNQSFERLTQGNISTLIKDSVIEVKALEAVGLSRERLFAELRCNSIAHLGEVKRVYIEANGAFSVIKTDDVKSGLSIIPKIDKSFLAAYSHDDKQVCCFCGYTAIQHINDTDLNKCPNCQKTEWTAAVQLN